MFQQHFRLEEASSAQVWARGLCSRWHGQAQVPQTSWGSFHCTAGSSMGLYNLQRGASIFSAALGRQKMKNIVPTSKNSASDGWERAMEIRKGIKPLNPPCFQHLWESPTLCSCTCMGISKFPSGLALIDKLQSPWTTLLDFKGWIFFKKKQKLWDQK